MFSGRKGKNWALLLALAMVSANLLAAAPAWGLDLGEEPQEEPAVEVEALAIDADGGALDAALLVSSDKGRISNSEYLGITVAFDSEVATNAYALTFSYDPAVMEYRGFTPPEGYTLMDYRIDDAAGQATFILGRYEGYGATALGLALFQVRDDATLGYGLDTSVRMEVEYVLWDAPDVRAEKVIKLVSATITFKTGSYFDQVEPTLIDLSNIIDSFGLTSFDFNWLTGERYDLNGNGVIDIQDITAIARAIRL